MKFKHLIIYSAILGALNLSGCSSDNTTDDAVAASKILSGTAAAGAPIVGQVTVKGALGMTKSAVIEANGNYDVDVTGLTAPYRIRAEGTVGGRLYKLHSYAEEADLGGTVNVTPFTDLIVANAASQIAESFFDSSTSTSLDAADVDAQEEALQAKLQEVFTALGLGTAIDLLNDTFSADHSGLDAALDIVRVEVDSSTNVATITNLIENSSITDDVTDNADTDVLPVTDATGLTETVADNVAIANLFDSFTAKFASGLPTAASIEPFFTADFLESDMTRSQFLSEITTDPSTIGLAFSNVAISNLTATTATVTFHVSFGGQVELEPTVWQAAKDATAGWQLAGDREIVDTDFSFHCNDYDGNGSWPGSCGINADADDNDFTNNGTNGAEIQSATVSVVDGTSGLTKTTIYLGTASNADGGSAGNLEIYNANNGNVRGYSGDWQGFGTSLGELDPADFAAGDTLKFDVYTEALDISNTAAPAIAANATPVATYSKPLLYAPATTGLYPSATAATLTAMDNFTAGDNLTVAWTKQSGTRNDEVLVEISDSQFNRVETYAQTFTSTDDTVTIATNGLDTSTLDQNAASYNLKIRIYTEDVLTGQAHSRDYDTNIDGPAATPTTPPVTGLACNTESGWDDTADNGLGAPITPYSFADYETVVTNCGTAQSFNRADVAGSVFDDQGETTSFLDSGTAATPADPETGLFFDGVNSFGFKWYIEDATCQGCTHSYVVIYTNNSIDSNLPAGFEIRETSAVTGSNGTSFTFVKYSEQSNYSDMNRATGADGEIWTSVETLLP